MLWYCRHAVLPNVVVVGVVVQDAVAVAMGQRGGEEIGEGEAPLVAATHLCELDLGLDGQLPDVLIDELELVGRLQVLQLLLGRA